MKSREPAQSDSYTDKPRLPSHKASSMQCLGQSPPTLTHDYPIHTSVSNEPVLSATESDRPAHLASRFPNSRTDPSISRNLAQAGTMADPELAAYITPDLLRWLHFESVDLESWWTASYEPPITKASLAELDLVRIINDLKLRHDLNFEREISFRPNLHGVQGQRKMNSARTYWDALTIDFALCSRRRSLSSVLIPAQNTVRTSLNPSRMPPLRRMAGRLPVMFEAIREILKSLVPGSEWSSIDERLDVDLIMQELENGVCDIKGLGDWLGKLLLGSCSPVRDTDVGEMMSKIHEGADRDDPCLLVNGLRSLFGILEMMKLDVANHQIRYLRLLMIEDNIHYEQTMMLNLVANGWDFAEARMWFVDSCGCDPTDLPPDVRLRSFTERVIRLVVDDELTIPNTFLHDTERIRALQIQCSFETHYRACATTLKNLLETHGLASPTHEVFQRLISRVSALLGQEGTMRSPSVFPIALEIIRELNRQRKVPDLPDNYLVGYVVHLLQGLLDRQSSLFASLRYDLGSITLQEIRKLESLSPKQMLDHVESRRMSMPPESKPCSISIMAKRIAHLTMLHWRIWAPILYEQSRHLSKVDAGISASMGVLSLDALPRESKLRGVSQHLPLTNRSLDEKLEPRSTLAAAEVLDSNNSESSVEYCDYSDYGDCSEVHDESQ